MTPSFRRLLAAVLCACALAAGGCAAPGGLGKGTPAPPCRARRSGVTAQVEGASGAAGASGASGASGTEAAGTAEAACVRTDVRRFERILTNLLANARRHGGEPVTVTVSGTTVTVRDRGPGFPEKLLREGPQRFLTGAAERGQGTGLGLTIALGQAQVIGARVTLENLPPSGALATVVLPPA